MTMSVGALRAALEQLPDHLPVIMSSDEEGNSFHSIYAVEQSKLDSFEGEPVHPDDVDDYDPEDLTDAVVLWP